MQPEAVSESAQARHYNLYDEVHAQDPFPPLREMQSKCPVAYSEENGGYWLVTSYQGTRQVLANPEAFSSVWTAVPPPDNPIKLIPLTLDPPQHTKYRQIFTPLFSPSRIRNFEPAARAKARTFAEQFAAQGGGDFIADFAVPFPGLMFLEICGLPVADLPQLLEWKETFIREFAGSNDPQVRARAEAEVMPKIVGYFGAAVDARRKMASPPDDVLTGLVQASVNGEPLSDEEIANALILFMAAGLDTVTNVLGLSLEILAGRPDLRRQIIDDPTILSSATEELLRYCSIVTSCRKATEDAVVEGVTINAGDWVAAMSPIASRDPAEFDDPETINFGRKHNRHLAFGTGPHRCLGSHLARLELATALAEIHRVMPNYSVTAGTTPDHHFGSIMGCRQLMLTVEP